ncbi:MAG TPA: GGDEF domain-containing protein [Alphaproteobacteria bacterium]|nr:GGDEF domain-containing protein [Alphaproteobacteria bacterium]
MSFVNEKERELALVVSGKALERMAQEELIPTPEHYELWYVYYSRAIPEVVRVIDGIVESGQSINDYVCGEIYNRFLSDLRNEEAVRNAGDQVQNAIHNVSGMVEGVKNATKSYGSTLEDVTRRIGTAKSQDDLKQAVSVASQSTASMIEQNHRLEEMLLESTQIMEELKRDLEHVRREAMTDGLTGLANRKCFDSEMDRVLRDFSDRRGVFSILMLDIDYFKSFNDNFGHQVGDQVLRLVARTLKDGLKGKDVAARYGGEEFSIILPDTDLSGAVIVGNALRKAVAGKDVINRSTGKVLGRITLSVGVAEFAGEKTAEQLIARADEALYTAKHNGRNQVAAAPSAR